MVFKRAFLQIILIYSLFVSLSHAIYAQETDIVKLTDTIAAVTARPLFNFDDDAVKNLTRQFFIQGDLIKSITIIDSIDKSVFYQAYFQNNKITETSILPDHIKQHELIETTIHYDGKDIGKLIVYYHSEVRHILSTEEKNWLNENNIIKLAIMSNWDHDNNGEFLETEIIKLINKYAQTNIIAYKYDSWEKGLKGASAGVDVHGIFRLSYTPQREQDFFYYTKPYQLDPLYLITKKSVNTINSLKDLENKAVYVQQGVISKQVVELNIPSARPVEVATNDGMYEQLAATDNARAILSYDFNEQKLEKYNFKIVNEIHTREGEVSIGINHKYPHLYSIINKAFKLIPKEELSKLSARSFQDDTLLTPQEKLWLSENNMIKLAVMDYWDHDNEGNSYETELIKLLNQYGEINIISYVYSEWAAAYKDVTQSDEIHGITHLSWTAQREKEQFYYTKPYRYVPLVITTRNNNNAINNLDDLKNKTVYIKEASVTNIILENHVPSAKAIVLNSQEMMYKALAKKEGGDAMLTSSVNEQQLKKYNLKKAADLYIKEGGVAIGISHQYPLLYSIINKSYKLIPKEELLKLSKRVFNARTIRLTENEKQWIKKHPVINFVADPAWEPIEFIDKNGNHKGIVSSYLQLITRKTGLKFELTPTKDWADALHKAQGRETDMIAAAQQTDDRTAYLNFSQSYIDYPMVMVTRQDKPFLSTIQDLYGKTVVMVETYATTKLIAGEHPDINLIYADNDKEALEIVAHGRAYAFVAILASVSYKMNKYGFYNLKISGKTEYLSSQSIAIRNDWDKTGINIINKALDSISLQEKNNIFNQWIAITFNKKVDYTTLFYITGTALVIILFILYWTIKFKKEVQHRKKIAKELHKAREDAESATRAKSDFLANMSHEIRTPMNAILGFTELLDTQIEDSRHKSYTKTIKSAGNSLLTLINDILDLSKIEAGKIVIDRKPVNPYELFKEIKTIFMLKMQEKGLDFMIDIDEHFPKSLLIDEVRLRQIILNLVGNAIKFTSKGHIKLSAKIIKLDKTSSSVDFVVEIEDTGIGIKEDQLQRIFNSFEQQSGQSNREYGGTGLGLSISRRLAELMDGAIDVKSIEGKGSVFIVTQHNVRISSLIIDLDEDDQIHQHVEFRPATILVVDDVDNNRELIRQNFINTDITILIAENGLIATQMVDKNAIDLIIMDIRMPVMNGYDAAQIIRKNHPDLPVIALTASIMDDEFRELKKKNFDAHLKKPVQKNDLFSAISVFLEYDEVAAIEVDKEVTDLPQKAKDNIVFIRKLLQENIAPLIEQSIKSNNINEIKDVAEKMADIAREYEMELLENYAAHLYNAVDIFDIAEMQKLLKDYSGLEDELLQYT